MSESQIKPSIWRSKNKIGQWCLSPLPENSFLDTIREKLKHVKNFGDCWKNDSIARDLADKGRMMSEYFSKISGDVATQKINEKSEECEMLTPTEVKAAKQRAVARVEEVARFEVKLLLTPVDSSIDFQGISCKWIADLVAMPFGSLHAAILINGIIFLDWNNGSLVIPRPYDESRGYAFITTLFHQKNKMEAPCDILEEEVDLILKATENKQKKINALVDVISNYNRQYFYNPIFRNCQHFVINALEAMGYTVPKFEDKLRTYFFHLKSGKGLSFFEDHQQLDEYVLHDVIGEGSQTITIQTMESLVGQYWEFHNNERKTSDKQAWQCSRGKECMLHPLCKCIDKENKRKNRFIQEKK